MNKQPRVVVAMSGGVDSSVAAALLVQQGYEVIGMMMRLWSEPGRGANAPLNRCCTPDQMADARRVADKLDIPFYVVDVQDHFRKTIVQFFIDEHARGRTPNPCIECNRQIRFSYLLDRARALGADYLATGHYARIRRGAQGYELLKAIDESKDQSYVLHVLSQEDMAHVLFPVGEFTKDEVRTMAREFDLPVASKQESMDLCFLGDGDYRRFLSEYAADSVKPGPIVSQDGEELGRHEGLMFYTIGQRKGLGISVGQPIYVLRKDVARNALVVGTRDELGRSELLARDVSWLSGTPPNDPVRAEVKIRYKARPATATVIPLPDGRARVRFDDHVFGATSGQGVTFYDGELCLGGGLIADSVTIGGRATEAVGAEKGQ
ncbi:MAG: tRNA 2-thiouridine(34) synthase MnmA [Chloroflexota bacterium]